VLRVAGHPEHEGRGVISRSSAGRPVGPATVCFLSDEQYGPSRAQRVVPLRALERNLRVAMRVEKLLESVQQLRVHSPLRV